MHRRPLLEKLSLYRAFDEREAAMTDALRQFVEEHPDCFERSRETGHLTGSAWIVDHEGTCALLTHHRKLDKWLQPGGHADGDPDMLRVAMREAREESGVESVSPLSDDIFDIDIHPIPARGAEPAHIHYDVRFLLQGDRAAPLITTGESKSLEWVELSRISQRNADESIARLVAKTVRLRS